MSQDNACLSGSIKVEVKKVAYIRKRGNKWSFTVNAGIDPVTGKRKQITRSGFASEKEAIRAAAKLEQELEAGRIASTPTLQEFATMYFETNVKNQVDDNTYVLQWHLMKQFVLPKLGKYKLDKITPFQLEKFYRDLLDEGVNRGTVKMISMVINKTFRTAQKWNYIIFNVTQHVKSPAYNPPKMKIWTAEEVKKFIEGTKGTRFHIAYVLALTTGMRMGEILGLMWEDIDFERKELRVIRSLQYNRVNGIILKKPKTDYSQRTIALPDSTVEALLEHKQQQLPGVPMVVEYLAKHPYPQDVYHEFQRQIKRLEMPKIRFHDLRHTHATLLLQMGVNPKVVAERLGHANIQVTLNTYSHVLPSMQRDAADRLNSLF